METLKILVVDDEPGIRMGVSRILSRHSVSFPFMDDDYGFECQEAATAEDALEILEDQAPHIVLLDNKLPGMSGMELLEIINQKKLDVMVAMITSYASLEVAAKATDDGAWDFIPKPFTPAELKASVDLIAKQYFLKKITSGMRDEGKKIRYQFMSVLSHELKSPLNALESYLAMMQDRELGDDLEAYNEVLDRSMKRIDGMRSLIMDLLDFTKIRLEKKEDKIQHLEIGEYARQALATIKPMAIQRNIRVEYKGDEVWVDADPGDMDIMLNNLLSNAVKYNKEGGCVSISAQRKDGQVELCVKDTGIGMNEDEVSQLFKEFVRIKNTRTRGIAGSGLGLSIVSRIARLYGGHIEVKSQPDLGSEFRIRFSDL